MPEKSLDIVVRARNDTKRGFDEAKKNLGQFGKQLIGIGAGVIGVDTALKGLAATSMLLVAHGREQAAIQREDLVGMLDAQREANRGWAEMGRAVPLVGDAIGKMVETLGNTKHIEELKASILEIRKTVETNEKLAQQWARDTALERARLADAPQSELLRIGEAHSAASRKEPIASAWESRRQASQNLQDQKSVIEEIEADLRDAEKTAGPLIQGAIARKLEEAREVYRLIEREQKTAAATYDALRAASADKAAVAERKAASQADAEWKKFVEEGEKRRLEAHRADQARADEQRRFLQEAGRLYEEQARQEKALEEQRERERRAALERQYAAEDALIRDRESLQDTLFAARHSAEEVRIREIKKTYDEMAARYNPLLGAGNKEMLALIEAARAAELSSVNASRGPLQSTDVAAFSARFLRHAPGRTVDPAEKSNEHLTKMQGTLEKIDRKLDVQIQKMEWQ